MAPEFTQSSGLEAVELASLAGIELDEWQRFVLINALGERDDGRWAARSVGVVVGRQNGKNVILEAIELAGLFLLGEETIVHSAHEQATSSEHFRRMLERIEAADFQRRILKVSRGKGSEAIELHGGQRVLFKTRTGGGGRGFSFERVVFDEAMILSPEAKSSLVPTLAGKSMHSNLQLVYSASAVDQLNPKHDGVELARLRANALAGRPDVAYFEWSAEGDDPAAVTPEYAASREAWALANPGLGVRISEDWVEHERQIELGAREFAVERLGIGDWPDPEGAASIIDMDIWRRLVDETSTMVDPVAFAFDVSPDRSTSCVSVAGLRQDGLAHVEVIAHLRGTGWVLPKLQELKGKWRTLAVVCSGNGPAAALVDAMAKDGNLEVQKATAREDSDACGVFYDSVDQETLRHLGTTELSMAVRGAAKRPLGEAWAWSRKNSSVDITPLVSSTLALWAVRTMLDEPKPVPRVINLATV